MPNSTSNLLRERPREANRALWIALALSAILHVPLLLVLPTTLEHDDQLEETEFNSAKEFSVSFVERTEQQDDDKDDEEELRGQFISAPAPEKEERPDEAKFRDQFESKTDREMARRTPSTNPDRPDNPNRDEGGRAPTTTRETSTTSPSIEERERREEEMRRARNRADEPDEPREDIEEARREREATEGDEAPESEDLARAEEGIVEAAESSAEAPDTKSIDPSTLFPSYADASGVAGGGGSIDYMRDVPEGDKNLLNRKRSRYWSFMDRIKQQVVQQWSPVAEYRRRDPSGDVYGVKDKVSILGVTLNSDGSIRKIYVAHPSGLDFYDDEAVRALRAAAPFPNPPEGLKDQDGLIHFNFMFVLAIDSGGGPLLRIRRR